MNKQFLRKLWRYIHKVHPWYFLLITLICLAIAVPALRKNNERMVQLREAVYVADRQNGDVEAAMRALREHVYGHLNTSLTTGENAVHPPIQLKYTYERAQAAQQEQLGPGRSSLYHEAQASCEAQNPSMPAPDLIACVESYTADRGVQLGTIPDALYKFDFTSAKWSPDLAGWSLVLAVLSGILFFVTAIYRWILKQLLK